MKRSYWKIVFRSIRGSIMRYLAILMIIALGVGFFAGLKSTMPAFYATGDKYIRNQALFDFRILSTIGFDEQDVKKIGELPGIRACEGASFKDGLVTRKSNKEEGKEDLVAVVRFHTMTEDVNTLKLIEGRLPEKDNEVVIDEYECPSDFLGDTLILSDADGFSYSEYEVVGFVRSPYYLNFQRGTSEIGDGTIDRFVYVRKGGFVSDQYSECFVKMDNDEKAFSDAYDEAAASFEKTLKPRVEEVVAARSAFFGLPDSADYYILKRDTNVGYVSFDNDAKIVDGIASVFPIFFFALAALVCSTTMQRMVSDERSEIGTMRAVGYSKFSIILKYVIYSGSASVIGAVGGFAAGTKIFPFTIWKVYDMMYGFAPITFTTEIPLFLISLLVSLLCSVGVTIVTCFSEFTETPAELVRPKAPPSGKRIFLEYITPVWKRLSFLHKVSARNVFRFKKRMWMMIIGIAGCTALLITGFGLKDSINNLINFQYDEIMTYDVSVSYSKNTTEEEMEKILEEADSRTGIDTEKILIRKEHMKHNSSSAIRDVELFIADDPKFTNFVRPHKGTSEYGLPKEGTIGISLKLAESNSLSVGDTITLEYGEEGKTISLPIDYIFENYTFHYAIISASTYTSAFGEEYEPSDALLRVPEGRSYEYGSAVGSDAKVSAWNIMEEGRKSFSETMEKMNYIVILVIICAALLAFIVLFNLNNINIAERTREIATLKVLGFRKGETGSYVFRENFILCLMGFVFGIPMGIYLHRFVISQIKMDIVAYKILIFPQSYVYSLLLVILFSLAVDLMMRGKIRRIDMTESLKSIE
ncbi:MAG TPA: ABC transporter permease [Clostridiales bacterium]|nr:ABC transporter permease [Saccharofermentanaceae bacterium]HBY32442.1 ABC transporter permease [Clostridiales bacterium]